MTQTVLITGATSGIGYTAALAFAKTGANVAISGRRRARGANASVDIEELGSKPWFLGTDVWGRQGGALLPVCSATLASDRASDFTGQTITVDGGQNIRMSVAGLWVGPTWRPQADFGAHLQQPYASRSRATRWNGRYAAQRLRAPGTRSRVRPCARRDRLRGERARNRPIDFQ